MSLCIVEGISDDRFEGSQLAFSQNISLGSSLSLYLERGWMGSALRLNLGTEDVNVHLPNLNTEVI
jgi:hypothetical protein